MNIVDKIYYLADDIENDGYGYYGYRKIIINILYKIASVLKFFGIKEAIK